MEKITGIKSVDFKITAAGHGVVNWNGPTKLHSNGRNVDNHTLPKLRGYTNLTGKVNKETTDIDFKQTPLYISQNCIRHHLFREHAFDLHYAEEKNLKKVLASITGLIRGYVVPASQYKRTSPLLFEDFVEQLGNGNYEQFNRSGKRDNSSFFSKTTFGDTQYLSYGSISIEQLQFISMDKKFDRAAMEIQDNEGEVIAKLIEDYIQSLNPELNPKAVFHPSYVRKGTIFEIGEAGVLLNQDAIQILVDTTLEMIRNLTIRQSKSYMYVEEVICDFNDSNKMMRIKRYADQVSPTPRGEYAVYFKAKQD